MKKIQYLAFILVAVLLNACSDKFVEHLTNTKNIDKYN
ncbi:putative lipoprotein [Helicobacter pylori NQ4076]|uniref:Putative lipoprotein n=1 Tax=Helicobacter pylori NQ4076 TaxID=992029 RepID=I9QQD4_HELPX|nr:putative lipoprotein [Helicobacter pylori NQ4076]